MQTIFTNSGYPGTGKTTSQINIIGRTKSRTVYAVDRINQMAVRARMIREAADQVGHVPIIRILESGDSTVSVRRDFPILLDELSQHDHAVLICTHEALKIVSHAGADGWNLVIDEDPKVWASDTFRITTTQTADFLDSIFELQPYEQVNGYSTITIKANGPNYNDLMADDIGKEIANLFRKVSAAARADALIVVDLPSWDVLANRRQFTWINIWDVRELAVYNRVTILANAFDKLVSASVIRAVFPDIVLEPVNSARPQAWAPRDVEIAYLAEDHRAGSTFFRQSEEGRLVVRAWEQWASGRVTAEQHYWCVNNGSPVTLPGAQVSPKIAGSNAYRDLTQCSVLYTAKASGTENAVFSAMTGGAVSRDDIMRDREYEDLIQIVFRSSLRMPLDDRPVMLNVYDRDQAEFLKSYFAIAFSEFRVTTQHHDIGVTRTVQKPGRKATAATGKAMTSAERMRRKRMLAKLKGGAK